MGTRHGRPGVRRAYRFLLRAYPASYRRRFGPAMEDMFADAFRVASQQGRLRALTLLTRTVWDHLRLGLLERAEARAWTSNDLNGALVELRRAPRVFRRHPRSALLTVVTLAIGIALCAVTLSVVNGTVVRGLPFDAAHRLVHFERGSETEGTSLAVTPHDFVYWREHQTSFSGLAAFVEDVVHLSQDDRFPERYVGVRITANALGLLGSVPALGRWMSESDDLPGAPPVVVLSHRLWRQRFGADSSLLGRTVRLNGQAVTVIGVMPQGFGFPIAEEFWRPLQLDVDRFRPGEGRLDVFGRLGPGVSVAEARAEFAQLSDQLQRLYPENTGIVAQPKSFRDEYIGPDFTRRMFLLLSGGLVALFISCLNVSSVLIAWSSRRRREFAVRTALGASSGRLVVQLIGEAATLTGMAAVAGLVLAGIGIRVLDTVWHRIPVFDLPHGPDALFWWRLELSLPVVAVVLVLAFFTSAAAATLPALAVTRRARQFSLGLEPGALGERPTTRSSRYVVIGQLALTTGLLVPGALLVTSVVRMSTIGSGLDAHPVATGRVALLQSSSRNYGTLEGQIAFWSSVEDQLRAGHGVAAIATALPVERAQRMSVELAGGDTVRAAFAVISTGYFDLFGIRPLAGRMFAAADGGGGPAVTLVNADFADQLGGVQAALGAQIRIGASRGEPWLTVVGVVPDLWMGGTRNDITAGVYVPLGQAAQGASDVRFSWRGLLFMNVAVRGSGVSGFDAMRSAVAGVDPSLPVYALTTFEDRISAALQRFRVYGVFYASFAGFALLLAVLGLYGLMAFSTTIRGPEIGLRKALGATTGEIVRGVVWEGLGLVAIGGVLGAVLAGWLSTGIRHLLYDITPWNPLVLAGVLGVLVATALVAAVAPAHRAARVDPIGTLRAGGE